MTTMTSKDAFDLSSNTTEQRMIIEDAIERCTFDFSRCLPRLKAEKGRDKIPVTWEDLSRFGQSTASKSITSRHHGETGEKKRKATLGLAYYSGRIVVEQSLISRPFLAQEIFLAEGAHLVDFFVLTPSERAQIFEWFHEPGEAPHNHGWFEETGNNDYWSWVGEAWMIGFIQAFTDIQPTLDDFVHKLTDEDIYKVRQLINPVEYYAAKWSYAFHDQEPPHWWITKHTTFKTRIEALNSGLRPCKLCKP